MFLVTVFVTFINTLSLKCRNSLNLAGTLTKHVTLEKIDNIELKTVNNLREYLYQKRPGETVTLNILREKVSRDIRVKLEKKI